MPRPRVAEILEQIVAQRTVALGGRFEPPLEEQSASVAPLAPSQQPFLRALEARSERAIIAEVKLGSPKLGSLADRVDPVAQAKLYRAGGAAALSVVVEPDFFFGSYDLLRECREASGLPAIAKDFLVSRRQLDWAAGAGADAVLIIAALYSQEELRAWADEARTRGLVPLVETHSTEDIALLGDAPWELVGVNNRDLRTFDVDLERSIALQSSLPTRAIAVAESGIRDADDCSRLAAAGFDAFLIGEALLLAPDPAEKLAEFLGRDGR